MACKTLATHRLAFNQYFKHSIKISLQTVALTMFLSALKLQEPQSLFCWRDAIGHIKRRSLRPRRVFEDIGHIKPAILSHFDGVPEIFVGFPWKADDDIGRDRDIAARRPQPVDRFEVFLDRMAAFHQFKHPVAARLRSEER